MPYVLPTPEPRRRWYNDYGETSGLTANLLLKALLAQAGGGGGMFAPKNIPNPGYGQTGSSGTQFSLAGANPNPLAPPSNVSYQPPTTPSPYATQPYATQPLLNPQQFKNVMDWQRFQRTAQDLNNNPLEKRKLELANQQAEQQIKINEDVIAGELIPVTLPTGQTIYMRPSKGGYVPVPQGQGASARDQARGAEFGALGTQTPSLPGELPNPKGMAEGTRATDTVTGQKYILRKGSWSPL